MKQLHSSQLPQDMRDLLDTLMSKVSTLQTQLEEVKQLMAISEADFTLLQTKVATIEENLTTLTTTVTGLETADTSFNTTLQAALERLSSMETQHLTMAVRDLTLSTDEVTEDITLPATDQYGSTITWVSSNELLITSTGVVTRPSYTDGTQFVTLTATLVYGEQSSTKEFVLAVIADAATDSEAVAEDASLLTLDAFDIDELVAGIQVIASQVMPLTGSTHGSAIAWASTDAVHFAADGTVTRPAFGETDALVTLTATLTNGTASTTKDFDVTVLAETTEPTTGSETTV